MVQTGGFCADMRCIVAVEPSWLDLDQTCHDRGLQISTWKLFFTMSSLLDTALLQRREDFYRGSILSEESARQARRRFSVSYFTPNARRDRVAREHTYH